MAWFFILPLSVLAGPAGLAVALACFAASRQKDSFKRGQPSIEAIEAMASIDAIKNPPAINWGQVPVTEEILSALLDRCGL